MKSTSKLLRQHLISATSARYMSISKETPKVLDTFWECILEKIAIIIAQEYSNRKRVTPDIIYEIFDSRIQSHKIWDFVAFSKRGNNSSKRVRLNPITHQNE